MKKKTIQPVTFSEVYTEVREQVMNECVRQKTAPVDPGSGSGSGSGSGGSGGVSSFMGTNSCLAQLQVIMAILQVSPFHHATYV